MSNKITIELPIKTGVSTQMVPPYFIRDNYSNMYSDEYLLQRLQTVWGDQRTNSVLNSIFTGASEVSTFILVRTENVLNELTDNLNELTHGDQRRSALKYTIKYLENILENHNGEYLILDGQHRLERLDKFFKGEYIYTGESLSIRVKDGDDSYMYTINDEKFTDYPKLLQNAILGLNEDGTHMENYPIKFVVSYVNSCRSFEDLVSLTVNSNESKPWTNHEKRIIIPSEFNHFIQDMCWETPQIKKMFSKCSNMSGEKSLNSKGDTFVISNWSWWANNSNKNPYGWATSSNLDEQSKICNHISKTTMKNIKNVVRTISSGLYSIQDKFKTSTLDNAFMLNWILSNPTHQLNPVGKKVSINQEVEWMDWFMKKESDRLLTDQWALDPNEPDGYKKNLKGDNVRNPESYNVRCTGTKPDGLKLRLKMMLDDFNKSMSKLEKDGVIEISEPGKFTRKDRKTLASQNNWMIGDTPISYGEVVDGKKTHTNHIKPASKGGTNDLENGELMKSTENIKLSNVV
jgi:hypothetical protein